MLPDAAQTPWVFLMWLWGSAVLPITHTMQAGITSHSGIVSTEEIWTQFLLQQMLIFKIRGGEHLFLWEGGEINQLSSLGFSLPAVFVMLWLSSISISNIPCFRVQGMSGHEETPTFTGSSRFFRLYHHPELCSSVIAIISL